MRAMAREESRRQREKAEGRARQQRTAANQHRITITLSLRMPRAGTEIRIKPLIQAADTRTAAETATAEKATAAEAIIIEAAITAEAIIIEAAITAEAITAATADARRGIRLTGSRQSMIRTELMLRVRA